jgi:hypothetical protein
VDVTVYCCSGGWDANKDKPQEWEQVGTGRFVQKGEQTRIVLNPPPMVRPGTLRGFYLHTKDITGVGFNSDGGRITCSDEHLQILAGAPTGSSTPFEMVSKSKWSFAGSVEYCTPGLEATQTAQKEANTARLKAEEDSALDRFDAFQRNTSFDAIDSLGSVGGAAGEGGEGGEGGGEGEGAEEGGGLDAVKRALAQRAALQRQAAAAEQVSAHLTTR